MATPGREREERTRSSQIGLTTLTSVSGDEPFTFDQPIGADTQKWSDEQSGEPQQDSNQHDVWPDQPLLLR